MAHHELLVAWLNDAYATEKGLIDVLEGQVEDAKNHPHIESRLKRHIEETRRHAEMIEGCLDRLDETPSSVKSGISRLMGNMQGLSTMGAKDKVIKNALAGYAAEHFEIASYRSLIAGAEQAGETEIARICEQILNDEQEMARWHEQQIPTITQEMMQKEKTAH